MFGRLATTGGLSIKVLALNEDISVNPFERELPYTATTEIIQTERNCQLKQELCIYFGTFKQHCFFLTNTEQVLSGKSSKSYYQHPPPPKNIFPQEDGPDD